MGRARAIPVLIAASILVDMGAAGIHGGGALRSLALVLGLLCAPGQPVPQRPYP